MIIDGAKEIGLHEFINSLPSAYEYVIGERGINLSVGQRQLIAFLRVYVRNSKILILDEATSSIDSKTEQLLQNALRRISTNRTTIIIAHRLSTILHADKIIFLNDGKIVESGTHTELIAQKGMYYKMYSSQTA
jgi:subfamily B ATP-binding cassette protein MsbA